MSFSDTQKQQIKYWLGYGYSASTEIDPIIDNFNNVTIELIITSHLTNLTAMQLKMGDISLVGITDLGGDNPTISEKQMIEDLKTAMSYQIHGLASALECQVKKLPWVSSGSATLLTWL